MRIAQPCRASSASRCGPPLWPNINAEVAHRLSARRIVASHLPQVDFAGCRIIRARLSIDANVLRDLRNYLQGSFTLRRSIHIETNLNGQACYCRMLKAGVKHCAGDLPANANRVDASGGSIPPAGRSNEIVRIRWPQPKIASQISVLPAPTSRLIHDSDDRKTHPAHFRRGAGIQFQQRGANLGLRPLHTANSIRAQSSSGRFRRLWFLNEPSPAHFPSGVR